MKRSEMLKVMSAAALNAGILDIGKPEGPSIGQVLDKVLSAMEKSGITPPATLITLPSKIIDGGTQTKILRSWEEESK